MSTQTGGQEQLLRSRRDAARILGVSVRSVDTLLAGGWIRGVKIFRRTMIPHSELVRLSKTGCAKGAERQ